MDTTVERIPHSMYITANVMIDALDLAAHDDSDETKQLLKDVLDVYLMCKKKQLNVDKDIEIFFDIINDIVHAGLDLTRKATVNKVILKLRKSPIATSNREFVENIAKILGEEGDKELKANQLNSIVRELQQWVIINKTKQLAAQLTLHCNRYIPADDSSNDLLIDQVTEYARQLLAIQDNAISTSATIDVVDMTDPKSMKKAMTAYKSRRTANVFTTGLKQLNKMLGKNRGFLRGEFVAFAASSHNFKSGMLMKCARWFCTKSSISVPAGMIPTVTLISLENEIPENSMDLIRDAYIDIYRTSIPDGMTDDELVEKISEYYSRQNIKFIMYRFDENFGYSDYEKLMTQLRNKGHCVVASVIDYLTLMRLEGDTSDNQAKRIQKLGGHFANYARRNNQLIVTGLQLNSAADELNASGKTNVVKQYKSYHLSDCKGLMRELDILIYLYIESNQDHASFLTGYIGKHRNEPMPSAPDRYFSYRFHPVLGILEDEGTDMDLHRPDIYADDIPSNEEAALLFERVKEQERKDSYNKQQEQEMGLYDEDVQAQEEYVFG